MSASISVEKEGLKGGIRVCDTCTHTLTDACKELMESYRNAGNDGWRDDNYAKLGVIVEECIAALRAPIPDIEDSKKTIESMLDILRRAETIF